ncbi:MAG: histidine triad nucleotide-binding protein [Pseudohongiella sp.]|nr:histidine triad nucleotide-binding protein [Pseudohongiella sp.]MDO9521406.1 histidine triad nucleotide-binding protein [Pseudohongiella sp.]MDP2126142.1 histidine triad nucleotide-binding protein [Pseudohongiella sp.]
MTSQCLFCRIAAGDIPSNKVYSDDDVYAFRDINPAAPQHILVIPRKHLSSLNDAGPEDQALMGKLLLSARSIAQELGFADDGFRTVINTGEHGGQTVFHIHVHVLSGRHLSWPPG